MAVSQPVGLVLLGVAVAARATGPSGPEVAWACLAAVFGTVGLAAFYRGMAIGSISVVAPIAAAAAIIPVAFGLATGDQTSRLQQAGFAVVIGGVVLTSLERGAGRRRWATGAGLGIVATLTFGVYFVLLHASSSDDFLWPAFLFRVVSTALVWGSVVALGTSLRAAPTALTALIAIGIFDTGGNTLFAAASTQGARECHIGARVALPRRHGAARATSPPRADPPSAGGWNRSDVRRNRDGLGRVDARLRSERVGRPRDPTRRAARRPRAARSRARGGTSRGGARHGLVVDAVRRFAEPGRLPQLARRRACASGGRARYRLRHARRRLGGAHRQHPLPRPPSRAPGSRDRMDVADADALVDRRERRGEALCSWSTPSSDTPACESSSKPMR